MIKDLFRIQYSLARNYLKLIVWRKRRENYRFRTRCLHGVALARKRDLLTLRPDRTIQPWDSVISSEVERFQLHRFGFESLFDIVGVEHVSDLDLGCTCSHVIESNGKALERFASPVLLVR